MFKSLWYFVEFCNISVANHTNSYLKIAVCISIIVYRISVSAQVAAPGHCPILCRYKDISQHRERQTFCIILITLGDNSGLVPLTKTDGQTDGLSLTIHGPQSSAKLSLVRNGSADFPAFRLLIKIAVAEIQTNIRKNNRKIDKIKGLS